VHNAIHAASIGEIPHSHEAIRQYLVSQLLTDAKQSKTILSVLNAIGLELSESAIVSSSRFADSVRTAFDLSNKKREIELESSTERKLTQAPFVERPASRQTEIFGSEVWLASARLDVAGRADKIEYLSEKTIRIIDLKTGAAADQLSELRQDYLLQIRCYALLVRELFTSERITSRIVASDGVWEEEFTTEISCETEKALAAAQAALPLHAIMDPSKSAEPGHGCLQCRFRPSCSAYRAWAPDQWRRGQGNLPLDTWGLVQSIEIRSKGLLDIRILDDARRHVRVLAIPESMLSKPRSIDSHLEMYELNSLETGGHGKYPRNFYVVNANRPYASAFSTLAKDQPKVSAY
jgi:hypothetical protein